MADGAGVTWIFLRGLTRETAHWGHFPDDFRQASSAASVITLDLPGNGQLHQVASLLSIGALVDFCRVELARRNVEPPYCLLAMSLGAMVAAEWACQAPQEIAGCVLINTSFNDFSPFYRRLQPRNYAPLLRLALLPRTPAEMEKVILKLTSNRVAECEHVIAGWALARVQQPVSTLNALRQLISALRYRARPAPPRAALLILCSEQDQLVHAECSLAIASRWNCLLAVHPSAGHDLPLDDPDWVIEQVRRLLDILPKLRLAESRN